MCSYPEKIWADLSVSDKAGRLKYLHDGLLKEDKNGWKQ